MHTLLIILLIIASIISFLLLLGIFLRKSHFVKCEIYINAPLQKVFDFIKLLKNQDEFNQHAMTAPDRQKTFKGTDGTVGYIYAWSGNKNAGEGEKEIMNIEEGKRVDMEIRFVKPMAVTAKITMETTEITTNKTKISWSNSGILKYPFNIMIPMMEKHVKKDMNKSLVTLKNILEK